MAASVFRSARSGYRAGTGIAMLLGIGNKLLSLIKTLYWRSRGHNISFHSNVANLVIRGKGKVNIDYRSGFRTGTILNLAEGAKITIGREVLFNDRCLFNSHSSITIGSRTVIGQNVCIYDHDHDYRNIENLRKEFVASPVSIGEDVWIGSNVTILRGVEIGDRCVIGAGTVVRGKIPADSLVYTNQPLNIKPIRREEKTNE